MDYIFRLPYVSFLLLCLVKFWKLFRLETNEVKDEGDVSNQDRGGEKSHGDAYFIWLTKVREEG